MPIGIITNVCSVALGGILGSLLQKHLSQTLIQTLSDISGFAAIVVGITLLQKQASLSAVVLCLFLGTAFGLLLRLQDNVNRCTIRLLDRLTSGQNIDKAWLQRFSGVSVLICFSGTGLYGALLEGLYADSGILFTKSILDFCTAMIFGASLGKAISFISVVQGGIFLTLFYVAGLILPHTTPAMIGDFSAVGGIITLMAGFCILKLKPDLQLINVLPSLIFAMPISWMFHCL